MLNREQIRENCGNMGTQGNFGREQGSPREILIVYKEKAACGYSYDDTNALIPRGGGVLPYLGYTGTCRWTGCGFLASLS